MRKTSTKPLLVAIVIDWATDVKGWAREISEWIVMLQKSIQSIDPTITTAMKEKCKSSKQSIQYSVSNASSKTTPSNICRSI